MLLSDTSQYTLERATVIVSHTAGQNDVTIGRAAAAVASGDGREFATDCVLAAIRQYQE